MTTALFMLVRESSLMYLALLHCCNLHTLSALFFLIFFLSLKHATVRHSCPSLTAGNIANASTGVSFSSVSVVSLSPRGILTPIYRACLNESINRVKFFFQTFAIPERLHACVPRQWRGIPREAHIKTISGRGPNPSKSRSCHILVFARIDEMPKGIWIISLLSWSEKCWKVLRGICGRGWVRWRRETVPIAKHCCMWNLIWVREWHYVLATNSARSRCSC